MTEFIRILIRLFFPKYEKYIFQIVRNKVILFFNFNVESNYLFILCPPYSGSTLMHQLISTSKQVSVNNPYNTREGQTLPTLSKIMFTNLQWDHNHEYDWKMIKNEWRKYWNTSKPILLEKSTPNLIRAKAISSVFEPSSHIVMTRNPYAQCESLMRRDGSSPTKAAEFCIRCLKHQRENIKILENSIYIPYELLTNNPKVAVSIINKFFPQLGTLKYSKKFSAHNYLNKKLIIQNLNSNKIKSLTTDQITELNKVFRPEIELLDFFNYNLLNPISKA